MGSKGHGLLSVIGVFQSVLCASVLISRFIACDVNSVIMIEGSKKCNYCEGGFELESSRICEKHPNGVYTKQHKLP